MTGILFYFVFLSRNFKNAAKLNPMNQYCAILLFIFSFFSNSISQVKFYKTIGGTKDDFGSFALQTIDGGFIVAGSTESFGEGVLDIHINKTDAQGNLLWTKTYGGKGVDYCSAIQETKDGGFILVGTSDISSPSNSDVYLIRTDANGTILWSKTIGGNGNDIAYSILQTSDGGFLFAGSTESFSLGSRDIYLIKTDSIGNVLWSKSTGGIGNEVAFTIRQTNDGGYILIGDTYSFGVGGVDILLLKIDSNGSILWSKTYGGLGDDFGRDVLQSADGGYMIAGFGDSFALGKSDFYLIKVDFQGNVIWSKSYGDAGDEVSSSVQQTLDGNIVIFGTSQSFKVENPDLFIIKVYLNGKVLWSKTMGGEINDLPESIENTKDGGFIICGTGGFMNRDDYDILLIKTDNLANSGCNEQLQNTIGSIAGVQTTNPTLILTSRNNRLTSPASITKSSGIINTICTSVGINELTQEIPFLILPNPSNGNFIINFNYMIEEGRIELFNCLGDKIYSDIINKSFKKSIHLKNIEDGIYMAKIYDKVKYEIKKIMIQDNY